MRRIQTAETISKRGISTARLRPHDISRQVTVWQNGKERGATANSTCRARRPIDSVAWVGRTTLLAVTSTVKRSAALPAPDGVERRRTECQMAKVRLRVQSFDIAPILIHFARGFEFGVSAPTSQGVTATYVPKHTNIVVSLPRCFLRHCLCSQH